MENCQKSKSFSKIWLWKWCYFSHFQWFWPGTTKKALFWHIFFNFGHEGAPNVTKITYNMIIWWENSPRKKIGAFSFTEGWAILFKKKNMDRSIDLAVQQMQSNACENSCPSDLRKQGHHFVKLYTLFCCIFGAHDNDMDRRGNGLTF